MLLYDYQGVDMPYALETAQANRIHGLIGPIPKGEYRMVYQPACGEGKFLDTHFPNSWWEKHGTEDRPDLAEIARKSGIIMGMPPIDQIVGVDRVVAEIPKYPFDLVILKGCLSSQVMPCTILRVAQILLKPGGLLAILDEPDFGYRRYPWSREHVPGATHIPFSRDTLSRILPRYNFTIDYFYPKAGSIMECYATRGPNPYRLVNDESEL